MSKEKNITLLAMDCDGVLTDGGIYITDDGNQMRKFNVKDGAWLRIWKREGLKTAIITGKVSKAVQLRSEDLEIDYLYQKAYFKAEVLEQLLSDSGVPVDQICYIGDDVIDIPVMQKVGFAIAVADAPDDVKAHADWITKAKGGEGAVQETIHRLLTSKGLLEGAMQRYFNYDEAFKTQ